jgi:hypothetical protein
VHACSTQFIFFPVVRCLKSYVAIQMLVILLAVMPSNETFILLSAHHENLFSHVYTTQSCSVYTSSHSVLLSSNTLKCQLRLAIIDAQFIPSPTSILEDDLSYTRCAWREPRLERFWSHVFALRVREDVELDFVALHFIMFESVVPQRVFREEYPAGKVQVDTT